MDISGIVVLAGPAVAAQARAALEDIKGVTVHAVSPEGKLVATLEADSPELSMDLFERIRLLPQVASLAMVYHQTETDPDQEI
jgi:periplasmic nitrate reductase NapD